MELSVHIEGLGEVVAEDTWWQSNPIPLGYLDGTPVTFRVDRSAFQVAPAESIKALTAFLQLSSADRLAASKYVHAHYLDTVDAIRSRPHLYLPAAQPILDLPIHAAEEVWSLITAGGVDIEQEDGVLYVSLWLNIPWDEEHGLQVVHRHGRELSRVSGIDGHLTNTDGCIYLSRAEALRRLEQRRRQTS